MSSKHSSFYFVSSPTNSSSFNQLITLMKNSNFEASHYFTQKLILNRNMSEGLMRDHRPDSLNRRALLLKICNKLVPINKCFTFKACASLSPWHGTSSACGWRRRPLEDNCYYIE